MLKTARTALANLRKPWLAQAQFISITEPSSLESTPFATETRLVLPGDGVGPEIVGATLDMLREGDRIFGLGLTFETAAIGFDSLRTAGTPSRIVVRVRPRDDLSTKGFSGAFTGKLAPTAQGKCGEHNSSKRGSPGHVPALRC